MCDKVYIQSSMLDEAKIQQCQLKSTKMSGLTLLRQCDIVTLKKFS